nr:PREDICTED: cytochrome P450 315a1, mitochondrial [Bemisia tabaci]
MVQHLRRLRPKQCCQFFKNYSSESVANAETKSIPSPKQWSAALHRLSVMQQSRFGKQLHKYVDKLHDKYGPIFRESLGPVTAVFISDPHEMRRVFAHEGRYPIHVLPEAWLHYNKIHKTERGLYFMNGEEWMLYRKLLNPLLLKNYDGQHILDNCELMVNRLIDEWYALSDDGEILNLEQKLYELSILFMVAVIVGSSFPKHVREVRPWTGILAKSVGDIYKESVALSQISVEFAAKWRLPAWRRFSTVVGTSFEISNELIKTMDKIVSSDGLLYQLRQCNIPQEKINTIILDFILAAGDTTATTTQWAMYLLSTHDDIQTKVKEEFENSNLRETCESDLMRGIVRETMRLYPVAPFIARFLPQDLKVFDSYIIPAGEMIILSVYSSGRNGLYFPDPDEFIPSRWERDEQTGSLKGVVDPFATLPYAMGARSCIGRKIAQTQICFSLATIFKQYEVLPMALVDMILHLIPVPDKPIQLHFEPRSNLG